MASSAPFGAHPLKLEQDVKGKDLFPEPSQAINVAIRPAPDGLGKGNISDFAVIGENKF
jgi:hypothetical protein